MNKANEIFWTLAGLLPLAVVTLDVIGGLLK